MKELNEYREKLIERLAEAAREFQTACKAIEDPFTKMEGEWNLHQIVAHLRDIDRHVYGARIMRTLKEDNPVFESFDPDSWMAAHYEKTETFTAIVGEYVSSIENLCKELRAARREAWAREGSHKTLGEGLTMQLWVERSLAHLEEHLAALKNA